MGESPLFVALKTVWHLAVASYKGRCGDSSPFDKLRAALRVRMTGEYEGKSELQRF